MATPIKIAFAEDMPRYRRALIEGLKEFGVHCIGEAANGKELLKLRNLQDADVVLLDLEMPVMDGNETMELLMGDWPDAKVLVLSLHSDVLLANHYLSRGAKGYLSKDSVSGNIPLLANAITEIQTGHFYTDPSIQNSEITFTTRQVEIIPLMCQDLTNKQIAERLSITVRSVEKQRKRIYERVGAKSITSFLKYALRRGFDFIGGK